MGKVNSYCWLNAPVRHKNIRNPKIKNPAKGNPPSQLITSTHHGVAALAIISAPALIASGEGISIYDITQPIKMANSTRPDILPINFPIFIT